MSYTPSFLKRKLQDVRVNVEEKKRLTAIISNCDDKLKKMHNLLLDGTLDSEDYKEIKRQIKLEKMEAEDALEKINDVKRQDFVKQLKNAFGIIENLPEYYKKRNVETKRLIIGSMFPENFIFENKEVRTNKVDPTFLLLCKNSKGLKRIKTRDKLENSNLSRLVQGNRQISNFIMQDVDIILHHAKLVGIAI